jgi:hypothetical protein
MPTATLNLTIVSKRMLTKREAAEHCGRPLKMFDLECPVTPSSSRMEICAGMSRTWTLGLTL